MVLAADFGIDLKPCYLSTGSEGGYLSRLADETQATQLALAVDVLGGTRKAESRGARLGPPHSEADDDGGVEDL
ncbi:hypothetical protein [Streptomyces sp. NPDC001100]